MNTSEQELHDTLIIKFKDKILAIRNYTSNKNEFYTDDFVDINTFKIILSEIWTGESDITPAGKAFLEEYYGYENLVKILYQHNYASSDALESPEETLHWLKNIDPLETLRFIEQSRGNIAENQPLNRRLLPPD